MHFAQADFVLSGNRHEAGQSRVDSGRIREVLGWRPVLDVEAGLRLCVDRYRAAHVGRDMRAFSQAQLTG